MTATVPQIVTEPGVYDLTDEAYHADPVPGGSLSSTGARKLLPPNCPARFRWEQDHPTRYKKTFDLGHAAHRLVLGAGPDLVRIDAEEWRSNAVKEQVAAVRGAGGVPLKPSEYEQVHGMADAIRRHPVAAALFDPAHGQPEQSLFWVDDESGVWCRARLDWQPSPRNGRLIVPDLKTTVSADPDHIQKAVHGYSYHQQAAFYVDGVKALGLADDPAFVFVFVEKAPPYLITVVQLDPVAEQIGRERNRRAIDVFRRCTETGHWPGYTDDIALIGLPSYAVHRHENEEFPS